jgi:hypothetical protein
MRAACAFFFCLFQTNIGAVGMTFATLSAENRARDMMREIGVSAAVIAVLIRIEASKLSLALRRLRPLSNEEGLRLTTTLNRLLEVRDAIRPFSLDLKDPEMTAQLLSAFEGMDAAAIHEKIRGVVE